MKLLLIYSLGSFFNQFIYGCILVEYCNLRIFIVMSMHSYCMFMYFYCMLPAGGRPATSWVHYTTSCNTQSSAPEDGQNYFPKHVELTGIIKKPLLLHLVGCLYYLYFITFF